MEVSAVQRFVRRAPRKARLVADSVKGMKVSEALAYLEFSPKHAARDVAKAIKSAAANAEENFALNRADLFVARIQSDAGPIRKWRRFGARGRFKPILKRSAHITVVLSEREAK